SELLDEETDVLRRAGGPDRQRNALAGEPAEEPFDHGQRPDPSPRRLPVESLLLFATCSTPKIRGRMAERFSREARSEPGGNLGKVVEGERRSPRPAQREPRVEKRHHAKRSGQTPRVTTAKRNKRHGAKRKYVT